MYSVIQKFTDGHHWEKFVRVHLKVSESQIQIMKQDYDTNCEEQKYQTLLLWVKRENLSKLMLCCK